MVKHLSSPCVCHLEGIKYASQNQTYVLLGHENSSRTVDDINKSVCFGDLRFWSSFAGLDWVRAHVLRPNCCKSCYKWWQLVLLHGTQRGSDRTYRVCDHIIAALNNVWNGPLSGSHTPFPNEIVPIVILQRKW